MATTHKWNSEFCSCGSDTCVCQGCGRIVCGAVAVWTRIPTTRFYEALGVKNDRNGNVGPCCFAKFGLGHAGTGESR